MDKSNLSQIILCVLLLSVFSHYAYPAQKEENSPLILYNGEVFHGSLEDVDTTLLARITRVDSLTATQVFGESGKNGAIILVSEEYLHPTIFVQIKKADTSTKICLFSAVCITIVLMISLVISIRKSITQTTNQTHQVVDKEILSRPNASIGIRALGALIDGTIISSGILFVLFWQLFGPLSLCDRGLIYLFSITWLIFAGVLSFSYLYFSELLFSKTIGKWVCGTRVVTEDNSPLSAKIVARRTWGRLAPNDSISFLFVEPDKNGRHTYFYHDLVSQTRVFKDINIYQQ